jgi:hypothetical protein
MMVMALGEKCGNNLRKVMVASQTEKEFAYKKLNIFRTEMNFRTPDDALVVRNILSFFIQILSQFVKRPSDTLLRIWISGTTPFESSFSVILF